MKREIELIPFKYICRWKFLNNNEGKRIVKVSGVSGEYLLNEMASEIWVLMDGKRTVKEIAKIISNNYSGVSLRIIEKDIIDLLRELEHKDIIIMDYNSLFPYKKLHAINKK